MCNQPRPEMYGLKYITYDLLTEFSKQSYAKYQNYTHATGVYETMLEGLIDGRKTPDEILTRLKELTAKLANDND